LKRFHPDARFLDLDNRRELDGIFTALEKSNLVVMDCRAASTDLFIDYFAEVDLPAVLSAMGASLTLVMPVNHEMDSVDQVQRLSRPVRQASAATSWSATPRTATASRCSSHRKCGRNSRTSSADGKSR
jgi:hypothetical protein